ncbi:MAG: hypothetical protein F9B45_12530 [Phycisphaera sp. RhM]|nr:hypothetical protein [Phycisphaera sp. RhM]
MITQVVPHIDFGYPAVIDYRRSTERRGGQCTFGGLEGFLAGKNLSLALRQIEGAMTSESVVDSLEMLGAFDIGLENDL